MLSDEAREARRAYKRAWAKQHPDKVKEQQARYWERRAAAAGNSEAAPTRISDTQDHTPSTQAASREE